MQRNQLINQYSRLLAFFSLFFVNGLLFSMNMNMDMDKFPMDRCLELGFIFVKEYRGKSEIVKDELYRIKTVSVNKFQVPFVYFKKMLFLKRKKWNGFDDSFELKPFFNLDKCCALVNDFLVIGKGKSIIGDHIRVVEVKTTKNSVFYPLCFSMFTSKMGERECPFIDIDPEGSLIVLYEILNNEKRKENNREPYRMEKLDKSGCNVEETIIEFPENYDLPSKAVRQYLNTPSFEDKNKCASDRLDYERKNNCKFLCLIYEKSKLVSLGSRKIIVNDAVEKQAGLKKIMLKQLKKPK